MKLVEKNTEGCLFASPNSSYFFKSNILRQKANFKR
jgi:hypothetical protein